MRTEQQKRAICKACIYWKNEVFAKSNNDEHRLCIMPKICSDKVIFESMGRSKSNANMYTLPDFGCNQFKMKGSGK